MQSSRTQSRQHGSLPIAESAHSGGAGCVYGFALENIDAALKSAEIMSRGSRVVRHNARGTTSMTIDDGLSAARALTGCKTVSECLDLHTELVKLNAVRATIRVLLLSVMTVQLAEEALFPLLRRVNVAFGLVETTVATQ